MSAYKQPYQQRVADEADELKERLIKLQAFFITDAFNSLSPEERQLLDRQSEAMSLYSWILDQRLALFDTAT